MTGKEYLINEIKKYSCICYYPSSGIDMSNIDFFSSGKLLWEERLSGTPEQGTIAENIARQEKDPDLFIHTDVNFYQEFESGLEELPDNCGIHGDFEIIEFKELPSLESPNRIHGNFAFAGKCFEYKFHAWGSDKIKTLIYCICENEYLVSEILLKNDINVEFIWSRNWNGGQTYGTWLANILDQLRTSKLYTDWLCIPGKRGEPRNRAIEDKYPQLIVDSRVKLIRNNAIRWIDEGAHGWVEEFDVLNTGS